MPNASGALSMVVFTSEGGILIVVREKLVPVAHERVVGLMTKIRVPARWGKKEKSSSLGLQSQLAKADQSPRETTCHTAWARFARTVQRMARSQSGPRRLAPASKLRGVAVSLFHGSSLSRFGASGKPGTVQSAVKPILSGLVRLVK